ncbi:peptidase M14 [Exilibacterium tricleocarpae]|uniref:Peptidase M14 n=1 Tax=Exilibacterium tricleocarpae TaxID=2591008 RepID=A0A545TNW0_9GAMM|nr:M14 family zinc carboxypeptidase [Exilibacterium tricleocarpae]TQV78903.1 peptidase M14 [Exilibacterium tricleocarpae]
MSKVKFVVLLAHILYLMIIAGNASAILPSNEPFSPAIPVPEAELGFAPGDWHARPEQITRYMERLAAASDRATLQVIGRSVEQRPLVHLIVTSPENQSQLESLRQQHLDIDTNDGGPLVIWLGYSIHGNEPSGSNAALVTAYHLVAGEAPWVKALLENTIVIIDPLFNPDGLARFATWANMHRGQQTVGDRLHRAHWEAWPSGRFNHYWFDMNRDWLPATQPESVARLQQFYRWRPHVLGDFHEHSARHHGYFFQPGVPSRQNPLTPRENVQLTTDLAQYHAKALEALGQRYYTRETFDDFYYGKGSTFPDINGSVGILYEQATARGHKMTSDHGDFTFTDGVRNQYATSLSTLRGADAMRQRLLAYPQRFYREAAARARKQNGRAWVFGEDSDPGRAGALVELLRLHQINVYRLAQNIEVGGRDFLADRAWVVPIRQRQSALIEAIFEQRTTFADNQFYDVSAWTLPSAFNLPFAQTRSLPEYHQSASNNGNDAVPFQPQPAAVAYHFPRSGLGSAAMALHLLNDEVRVYRVGYPHLTITAESSVQPGDFVVPVPAGGDRQALEQLLGEQAERWQVSVRALTSGFNLAGPDLGSPNIHVLKAVKPLLVVGAGVEPKEAGHIWHFIDRRLGLPVPMIDIQRPELLDLSGYTHLLMPDIKPKALPKTWYTPIRQWVKQGGVLVTQKRSARWAQALFSERPADTDKAITEKSRIDKLIAEITANKDNSMDKLGRQPYGQYRSDAADRIIGGAIFSAQLDLTHPLAQGYNREAVPIFLNSLTQLNASKNAYSAPLVLEDSTPAAGFASEFARNQLKEKPMLIADKVGKGLVVKFAFNPNFRAFWRGTEGLYLNALINPALVRSTRLPFNLKSAGE